MNKKYSFDIDNKEDFELARKLSDENCNLYNFLSIYNEVF